MKKKKPKLSVKKIKERFEKIYGKTPKRKELKQFMDYLKGRALIIHS
jgi:hypothetical protein